MEMHALLFTVIFQGLAFLAAVCVVTAVVKPIDFVRATLSPLLMLVGATTPAVIPKAVHPFIAAVWLLVLRVGFYMAAGTYGFLPVATP